MGGGGGLGLYPKIIVSSEEFLALYMAELAQNLTLEKSQGWAQSLAHYDHPSIWWPNLS